MGCYIKNAVKTAPVWRKMSTFAKNTAHIERRFKINAYLCTRGGRTATVVTSEAFSFFQTENFDNSHEKMERERRSSLGYDSIGIYLHIIQGCELFSNLFLGQSKAFSWIS